MSYRLHDAIHVPCSLNVRQSVRGKGLAETATGETRPGGNLATLEFRGFSGSTNMMSSVPAPTSLASDAVRGTSLILTLKHCPNRGPLSTAEGKCIRWCIQWHAHYLRLTNSSSTVSYPISGTSSVPNGYRMCLLDVELTMIQTVALVEMRNTDSVYAAPYYKQ